MRPAFQCGAKLLLVLLLACAATGVAVAENDGAEAHFRKAAAFAQQGKLDDAEHEYTAGLRLSPQSAAAYNNLGALNFQQDQFIHAAAAFQSARRLRPSDPEIAFNLGLALYKRGDAAGAIPNLIAGEKSAHSLDASLLLGTCYFSTRQWKQSIDALERYRQHAPGNAEALFMLEQAYVYIGDAKSSLAAAAELLKSYPNSPFTHQMLGEAYDRDGDVDRAVEEFQRAIAASPSAPQLHFMLGYVYWRWKRYAEAVHPLEDEVRINPGFARSYYYLGDIAFRKGESDRARDFFEKALHLDPSLSEASLGLGKAYIQAGRLNDGIAALRKAEATLDRTAEVHYWLGRALVQAGRKAEAEKELARVKELRAAEHRKAREQLNGAPVGERQQGP